MIKQSTKKSNKDKISLQDLQNNEVEIEKCKKDPVYFYNTYIRKEGQDILSKEEYDELVKEWEQAKSIINKSLKDRINVEKYPIKSNEGFDKLNRPDNDDVSRTSVYKQHINNQGGLFIPDPPASSLLGSFREEARGKDTDNILIPSEIEALTNKIEKDNEDNYESKSSMAKLTKEEIVDFSKLKTKDNE